MTNVLPLGILTPCVLQCCIAQVLIAIYCEPAAKIDEKKVEETAVSTGRASLYVEYLELGSSHGGCLRVIRV